MSGLLVCGGLLLAVLIISTGCWLGSVIPACRWCGDDLAPRAWRGGICAPCWHLWQAAVQQGAVDAWLAAYPVLRAAGYSGPYLRGRLRAALHEERYLYA